MDDFMRLAMSIKNSRKGVVEHAPPEPETLVEMFERIDRWGAKAEIAGGMYLDLVRQIGFVVHRLSHHAFIRWWHDDAIRLVWIERHREQATFWGTMLTTAEADEFIRLRGNRGIEIDEQFRWLPTGFGPFGVGTLTPRDAFVDLQGRSGIVLRHDADGQSCEVMLAPHTIRAQRQRWPAQLPVFVPAARLTPRSNPMAQSATKSPDEIASGCNACPDHQA